MTETFTKESIRQHHIDKISEILNGGGGPEELTNYLMSRISNVISYERRKYERRLLRQDVEAKAEIKKAQRKQVK
jgi:16S rRNA A1518/A1519 N6-dimethyltransferase RsmA/KsgA/DIM1 with predicted DNA glycosylase/AP lyase activity